MRITDKMLTNNFLSSLNKSKQEVKDLQTQIASNSKINKPSDSPSGTARSLKISEQLQGTDTFLANIKDSLSFMQTTSSTMESIQSEVEKVRVLYSSINNATNQSNYGSFADQIDLILNSMLNLANTEYDGKYVLGGTDNTAKPYGFTADGLAVELKVASVAGEQEVRISKNTIQKVNMTGDEVFGTVGTDDIFNTLIRVRDSLRAGNKPLDADVAITEKFNKDLLNKITNSGDIINRLTSTEELLENQNLELKELLSKEKDVDVAQAVMDLQNQQYFLELSYKMSSMILPKSLLDYM